MNSQFSLLACRNRLLLLLGAVALCGALVACSRAAGKPEMPPPETPTFPVEVAREVATNVETSLRTMLLALTNPVILVAPPTDPSAGPGALADCDPELAGDATDADGDNYPVEQTRTFDCELILGSLAATLVLMDKDDADPASGVTGKANSVYAIGAETPAFSVTTDVSLDVSRSDGAADYGVVSRGSAGVVTPFSRTDYDGTYDATLTGTFLAGTFGLNQGGFKFAITPADCETVDAALQEDCREAVQEAGSGIELEFQVATSGLMYDAAMCATTFTGGYFDLRAGDNVVRYTYDGCGPAIVTYNGQPLPPPEMPS